MRQMPIGVQDFKAVRDGDFYYVDKSMLIARILQENDRGVFLYTRPRRFGKSLNLSMLDAFFNIRYKGNTWFGGLEISEHPEFDSHLTLTEASADGFCQSQDNKQIESADSKLTGYLESMHITIRIRLS